MAAAIQPTAFSACRVVVSSPFSLLSLPYSRSTRVGKAVPALAYGELTDYKGVYFTEMATYGRARTSLGKSHIKRSKEIHNGYTYGLGFNFTAVANFTALMILVRTRTFVLAGMGRVGHPAVQVPGQPLALSLSGWVGGGGPFSTPLGLDSGHMTKNRYELKLAGPTAAGRPADRPPPEISCCGSEIGREGGRAT